ncbi:MAG: sulfate ABC transporter ATP-binding protein [Phycisphaeraceae bacterium]
MSIEVRNITKTFGSFTALDNVNLKVPTGELVALLGPSGSGKTTLLRIIAGLEQSDGDTGSILFHDEDVVGQHVRKRGVGFVFQHYALFRHMTVFENVAFGLRVRPRKFRPRKLEIGQRVHELLTLVQLEGLAGRYPHQLSGGQRQRVALARALAVEPKVLLLDEPFGALDAKVRKELRAWLRRLHDEIHVTSLFVTHDQDEALEVADRVVVMNAGRIEQEGTPDAVFHHPRTPFVMNFLGEVNRFHGRIEQGLVLVGNLRLQTEGIAANQSGQASIFVRPHELEVATRSNGKPSFVAVVTHIHSAGPIVRLEARTTDGQILHVVVGQDQFQEMDIRQNSNVYLSPRSVRIFAEDYAI